MDGTKTLLFSHGRSEKNVLIFFVCIEAGRFCQVLYVGQC